MVVRFICSGVRQINIFHSEFPLRQYMQTTCLSRMNYFSGSRSVLTFCFLVLNYSLLQVVSLEGQRNDNISVCSPRDTDCYFQRYGSLKLYRVEPIEVGYIRKLKLVDGIEHEMKTVAIRPPIFEIPNFLSHEECDHIIQLAKNEGLHTSQTLKEGVEEDRKALGKNTRTDFKVWDQNDDGYIDMDEMTQGLEINLDFTPDKTILLEMYSALTLDKDIDERISFEEFKERNVPIMAKYIGQVKESKPHTKSRHSRQAWIQNYSTNNDKVLSALTHRVQKLTKLPLELIEASEYLQVVTYGPMGHYNCHLDSDFIKPNRGCCHYLGNELVECRICRYATVLYFLDDVEDGGETAFPIADNSTFDEQVWMRDPENVCNLAKNCHKANVAVKPEKGKAVMWYNHLVDDTTGWLGQLDQYTFHGGCDIRRGTKWIANSWISVGDDRETDIWNWIELKRQQLEDEENEATRKQEGSESEQAKKFPAREEL